MRELARAMLRWSRQEGQLDEGTLMGMKKRKRGNEETTTEISKRVKGEENEG